MLDILAVFLYIRFNKLDKSLGGVKMLHKFPDSIIWGWYNDFYHTDDAKVLSDEEIVAEAKDCFVNEDIERLRSLHNRYKLLTPAERGKCYKEFKKAEREAG
jgi:hypothetical protein